MADERVNIQQQIYLDDGYVVTDKPPGPSALTSLKETTLTGYPFSGGPTISHQESHSAKHIQFSAPKMCFCCYVFAHFFRVFFGHILRRSQGCKETRKCGKEEIHSQSNFLDALNYGEKTV